MKRRLLIQIGPATIGWTIMGWIMNLTHPGWNAPYATRQYGLATRVVPAGYPFRTIPTHRRELPAGYPPSVPPLTSGPPMIILPPKATQEAVEQLRQSVRTPPSMTVTEMCERHCPVSPRRPPPTDTRWLHVQEQSAPVGYVGDQTRGPESNEEAFNPFDPRDLPRAATEAVRQLEPLP